jgi:hypothetical protein
MGRLRRGRDFAIAGKLLKGNISSKYTLFT